MPAPHTTWTVLPHGPLTTLEPNLMTVTGTLKMPLADFERRMTIARLADRRLVVFSPICLDEPEMQQIDAAGTVSILVVPSDRHRLDVQPWKARYRGARVLAPAGARKKVEELVFVDATSLDFGDPNVQFITVPGTDEREAGLLVRGEDGVTLVLNEIIFNAADQPGLGGWLMHKLGMTGDAPHIPPVVKIHDIPNELALVAQFEAWAKMPDLSRIVVSHGDVIEDDASGVLLSLAHDMPAFTPTAKGASTRY